MNLVGTDYIKLSIGETATVSLDIYITNFSITGTGMFLGVYDLLTTTILDSVEIDSMSNVAGNSGWHRVSLSYTNVTAGVVNATICLNPDVDCNTYTYKIDGMQLENKSYATTYCDGSQEDCQWLGVPSKSMSIRKNTFKGGKELDFSDDLRLEVTNMAGYGNPPVSLKDTDFATSDGFSFLSSKFSKRNLTLNCFMEESDMETLHSTRSNAIEYLSGKKGDISSRTIERRLLYNLDTSNNYSLETENKYIDCVYAGGLEGNTVNGFSETTPIQFIAHNPNVFSTTETGQIMSVKQSATVRNILGKVNGVWTVFGPSSSTGQINSICEFNNKVYIGGSFTNWNGIAAADYFACYDLETDTWSALGTYPTTTPVYNIKQGADGYLYVGSDKLYQLNGTTWTAVGSPSTTATSIRDWCFATDGNLYIVGDFTNWHGIAAADYIAKWSGSAWTAPTTTGANGIIYAIEEWNGYLYLGGAFTVINSVTVKRIAQYKLSTSVISVINSDGFSSGIVYDMVITESGRIYVGGTLANASLNYLAYIENGVIYSFGTLDSYVTSLCLSTDRKLYMSGDFGVINGVTISRYACYDGNSWIALDADMPSGGAGDAKVIHVNKQTGNLYLGGNLSGTGSYAGSTTINYTGTSEGYPSIIIKRLGSTKSNIISIINETTGAIISFNNSVTVGYGLQNGEVLTIQTNPNNYSITSSFVGNVYSKLSPSSDIENFFLVKGNNIISVYTTQDSSYIDVRFIWKVSNRGID